MAAFLRVPEAHLACLFKIFEVLSHVSEERQSLFLMPTTD
jgi:hypothetical protein